MKTNVKTGIGIGIALLIVFAIVLYVQELKTIINHAESENSTYRAKIAIQDSIIIESMKVEALILASLPQLQSDLKKLRNEKQTIIFNPPNRDYWISLSDKAKYDTLSKVINRLYSAHTGYIQLLLSDTLRQPISIPE